MIFPTYLCFYENKNMATHVKLDSFDNQVFANYYISFHYETVHRLPSTVNRVAKNMISEKST